MIGLTLLCFERLCIHLLRLQFVLCILELLLQLGNCLTLRFQALRFLLLCSQTLILNLGFTLLCCQTFRFQTFGFHSLFFQFFLRLRQLSIELIGFTFLRFKRLRIHLLPLQLALRFL